MVGGGRILKLKIEIVQLCEDYIHLVLKFLVFIRHPCFPSVSRQTSSKHRTPKGRFTRYDFVACDKLTTGLRHDLRLSQRFKQCFSDVHNNCKSCRGPVVSRCRMRQNRTV